MGQSGWAGAHSRRTVAASPVPGGAFSQDLGRSSEEGWVLKEVDVFLWKVYLQIYVRGCVFFKPRPLGLDFRCPPTHSAALMSYLFVWVGQSKVKTHKLGSAKRTFGHTPCGRDWTKNERTLCGHLAGGASQCPPRSPRRPSLKVNDILSFTFQSGKPEEGLPARPASSCRGLAGAAPDLSLASCTRLGSQNTASAENTGDRARCDSIWVGPEPCSESRSSLGDRVSLVPSRPWPCRGGAGASAPSTQGAVVWGGDGGLSGGGGAGH